MSVDLLEHHTFVTERTLPVSPSRAFRAFSNDAERKEWDFIGADSVVVEHHQSFVVGGKEVTRFGPAGNPRYLSEGTFVEIVPDRRLVEVGTFCVDGRVAAATVVTLEFLPQGDATRFRVTDQSTFFGLEENPKVRETNWNGLLDKFQQHLRKVGSQ